METEIFDEKEEVSLGGLDLAEEQRAINITREGPPSSRKEMWKDKSRQLPIRQERLSSATNMK